MLDPKAKVQELINPDIGSRKRELVYQIFRKEEAKIICSLPLSLLGPEDKPCWWPVKNEIFSVKSAYHLALSKEKRFRGESLEKNSEKPN